MWAERREFLLGHFVLVGLKHLYELIVLDRFTTSLVSLWHQEEGDGKADGQAQFPRAGSQRWVSV